MDVKTKACEELLQDRVNHKFKSNKVETIMNRLTVAIPKARDTKARPAFIPEAALKKRREKLEKSLAEDEEEMETWVPKRKTEREIELEQGDDYIVDLKKNYDLPDDQKYDIIPETWQGHNIADFIDPEIMEKLEALEKEEEARDQSGYYDIESEEEDENMKEIRTLAGKIRIKKKLMKNDRKIDRTNKPIMPRTSEPVKRSRSVSRLKSEFTALGVDMTGTEEAKFAKTPNSATKRKARSASRDVKKAKMDEDTPMARRAVSRDKSGIRDAATGVKIKKMEKKMQNNKFNKWGKSGESDRKITTKMPKHLFSGKRGNGTNDRR